MAEMAVDRSHIETRQFPSELYHAMKYITPKRPTDGSLRSTWGRTVEVVRWRWSILREVAKNGLHLTDDALENVCDIPYYLKDCRRWCGDKKIPKRIFSKLKTKPGRSECHRTLQMAFCIGTYSVAFASRVFGALSKFRGIHPGGEITTETTRMYK